MPDTVGRRLSTYWLVVVLTTAWIGAAALIVIDEVMWAITLLVGATLYLRSRMKALNRVRSVRRRSWSRSTSTGSGRRSSTRNRPVVRMARDPVTGRIDGIVLDGPHAGRSLRALPLDAMLAVAATIDSADVTALAYITNLLDELYPGWSGDTATRSLDTTPVNVVAARNLLGVDAKASHDDICAAHRRLIRRVHPDVGGSAALTAEVNAAKDLLLSLA